MKGLRNLLFISLLIVISAATSCISDEITDSPDAKLSFSADTVNFGTLFTQMISPTARLVVHNPNNKGVILSSIRFRSSQTPFRLNIDGVSGSEFRDIQIRAKDSIYVFIDCNPVENESNLPKLLSDKLDFELNGITRSVEVEAWGWNVTRLHNMTITEDITFTSDNPYIVFDTLLVKKDATLTLAPGTRLFFHDGAKLKIEGNIIAQGDPDNFIRMSGDRLDDILPDVPYDILAGQWEGIEIGSGSYDNRLEYVDMRSTSMGIRIDSCGNLEKQKLTLINCWLHNSQSNVLNSLYSKTDAYGCCFSDAGDAVVSLTGGEHHFVQCTIANYYLFSALYRPNLMLNHCLEKEATPENKNPLMKASFENGIIWGEIGSPLAPGDLEGSDVYMRYMLLKADGSDDNNFIRCIWNEDPLFYTDRSDYYFNYRLQPDSPAFGMGNPAYVTPEVLTDMDGLNRLANGNPALGAYSN